MGEFYDELHDYDNIYRKAMGLEPHEPPHRGKPAHSLRAIWESTDNPEKTAGIALMVNRQIVGFMTITRYQKDYGAISNVIIGSWWRRKGYGRMLVRHAKEKYRARGCKEMGLTVNDCNPAARLLYEELGFRAKHTNMYVSL